MSVVGSVSKEVKPNKLVWDIQVVSKGPIIKDVAESHLTQVDTLIRFLKENKIKENELSTSGMSLRDDYDYRNSTRIGFVATTKVNVVIRDLDLYEEFWMALSEIEDVRINSVDFAHDDLPKMKKELHLKALKAAKAKASTLAKAMDAKIGRVLYFEEQRERYNSGDDDVYELSPFEISGTPSLNMDDTRVALSKHMIGITKTVTVIFELI